MTVIDLFNYNIIQTLEKQNQSQKLEYCHTFTTEY